MGGVVDTIGSSFGLGSDGPKVNALGFNRALRKLRSGQPGQFRSGLGASIDPRTGELTFNPETLALRDEGLAGIRALRDRIPGNRADFIEARTAPIRRQFEQREAQLGRDLGRRGVFGTFSNQAEDRLAATAGDEIGRAQAEATFLADQQSFDRQRQIATDLLSQGQQQFANQLTALGFSQDTVNEVLRLASNLSTGQTSNAVSSAKVRNKANQQQFENLSGLAGGIASVFL